MVDFQRHCCGLWIMGRDARRLLVFHVKHWFNDSRSVDIDEEVWMTSLYCALADRVRDGKVTAVEALGFIRRQCAELEVSADDPLGVAVCKSSLGEIADVLDACLDKMPEAV
jgi:hypothetical protein